MIKTRGGDLAIPREEIEEKQRRSRNKRVSWGGGEWKDKKGRCLG